jgi:hypothetical protein
VSTKVTTANTRRTPEAIERDASRVCVICRRALAEDDRVMDIHGLGVHVGCAAYRRRRGRR